MSQRRFETHNRRFIAITAALFVFLALAYWGVLQLAEYNSGFKSILPDGIQIYGDSTVKDSLKLRLDFTANEGTVYRSSFVPTLEFFAAEQRVYTFAVAMPYHVYWVQNKDPPNLEGKEHWEFNDDPSGGTLITATYTPNSANTLARISANFGFDRPIAVQDRGKYTVIIPILLASNVNVPIRAVERFDRVPTVVDVSMPPQSIPANEFYPQPDQLILRESQGGFSKHTIWHFDFSKATDPGQTILVSYILPQNVDNFNSKLFWAALWLGISIPTVISLLMELSQIRRRRVFS